MTEKQIRKATRKASGGVPQSLGAGDAAAGDPRPLASGLPGAGPGLPATAQRLLDAARRLLARSGFHSLSVEAIAREAGENKALIRYYFGSKNGLLLALVDGLVSDTLRDTRRRLAALSNRQDRSRLIVETAEALLADEGSYRLLFDLLPHLLENPAMAKQLAGLYRGYRDLNTEALWAAGPEDAPNKVRNLAAMTVALTDGLAVQLLAEPESVDVAAALAMWHSFVENILASVSAPAASEHAPESRPASTARM